MPPITSQYQRQVSMQAPTVAQPVQAQVKQNTKKQQRYAAISGALDTLTNLAVQKGQQQTREAAQEQQQLDNVSATIGLNKENDKANQWLTDPNNLGSSFEESYKKFKESVGTTAYTDNQALNTRVDMRSRAAFEQEWVDRKDAADKQLRVNTVYEQGVDMVNAQTKDNRMDYGMYDEYMEGKNLSVVEKADALLLLGNRDPNAYKYIIDNKLGNADQQDEAAVKFSSVSTKGNKPDLDALMAFDGLVKIGDVTNLTAIFDSGIYDVTDEKQKSLIKQALVRKNELEGEATAKRSILAGATGDEIRQGAPKEQYTYKTAGGVDTGVGQIEMGNYLTDAKIDQLTDGLAKDAIEARDTNTLARLRKRPKGIPFEVKKISNGLKRLVTPDGQLTAEAQGTFQLLRSYQSIHGGTGALRSILPKDAYNTASIILNRVGNEESLNTVLMDVGRKTRDGTIKDGVKDSSWTGKNIGKAQADYSDKLRPNQRTRVAQRAEDLGRMGFNVDDAYEQAHEEVTGSDGLVESSWFNPMTRDINVIDGRVFTQQTAALLQDLSRNPNSHDMYDWWLDETVKLNTTDEVKVDKDNLVLQVAEDGRMSVFDVSKGYASPLVKPLTPQEMLDGYLAKNPKLKVPKSRVPK